MNTHAVSQQTSWNIVYPNDSIRFIEAFRRQCWDYAGVCRTLDQVFTQAGDIHRLCELGCGTGPNLAHLTQYGYHCVGVDANEESIAIATERAQAMGVDTEFHLMDFKTVLPNDQYDAVLSLFVPLSIGDMEKLACHAAAIVRPGGYFACMLLGVLPEYRDVYRCDKRNMEFAEVDEEVVIRFNFYRKEGNQVEYDGIYLVGSGDGMRLTRDRDHYDLIVPDQTLQLPKDLYRQVSRIPIFGKPDQAPPMTYEVIDIHEKL